MENEDKKPEEKPVSWMRGLAYLVIFSLVYISFSVIVLALVWPTQTLPY